MSKSEVSIATRLKVVPIKNLEVGQLGRIVAAGAIKDSPYVGWIVTKLSNEKFVTLSGDTKPFIYIWGENCPFDVEILPAGSTITITQE